MGFIPTNSLRRASKGGDEPHPTLLNVYYNPQEHSDAVLDKEMPNWLAGLIPAIAFATIGTFIMIGKF